MKYLKRHDTYLARSELPTLAGQVLPIWIKALQSVESLLGLVPKAYGTLRGAEVHAGYTFGQSSSQQLASTSLTLEHTVLFIILLHD